MVINDINLRIDSQLILNFNMRNSSFLLIPVMAILQCCHKGQYRAHIKLQFTIILIRKNMFKRKYEINGYHYHFVLIANDYFIAFDLIIYLYS